MPKEKTRCAWVTSEPLYIEYHDKEWGRPVRDEQRLFEFLILEGAQAGLSWITVLKKRENYRQAFCHFDPIQIANFSDEKIEELLQNPGIIRNRRKILSAVNNAKAWLLLKKSCDPAEFLWSFVDNQPLINHWPAIQDVPTQSEQSVALSKALKKQGFSFIGPTICYAFMQAVGMINDHTTDCFLRCSKINHFMPE